MKPLSTGLGAHLGRLDARPLPALLFRLGWAVLCLFPFGWRFVPTVFRLEEVEPWLQELAHQRGIDLMDPAHWSTPSGLALRFAGLMALTALVTWALARLRRRQVDAGHPVRWLPVLWVAAALGLGAVAFRMLPPLYNDSGRFWTALPVWGGWVTCDSFLPGRRLFWMLACLLPLGLLELRLHVADLQHRLHESRDLALRARLAPHFLLNSFNTLIAQIEESPREAAATAERLSDLFRGVMEATRSATVPLRQELAFAEDLLALARDRFGDRLKVDVDVPEELLEHPVPVLGLQVLVENALKHGVEPRKAGGTVRIEARAEGRGIRLAVEDPGDGSCGEPGSGMSLSALRQRLRRPSDLVQGPTARGYRVAFSWEV